MIPLLFQKVMSKLILLAILLALTMCNKGLNSKHSSFLSGQGVFSETKARQIYNEYKSPYNERSFYRFQIFKETIMKVREHNNGNHSYTMGLNQFSDMTFQEFKFTFMMEPTTCNNTRSSPKKNYKSLEKFPAAKDWSNIGLITGFKQRISKMCGAHWAYAAVGSLEAFHNKYFSGNNRTFSDQQVIDCSGGTGCSTGIPSSAFKYIREAGGIQSDKTYPFIDRSDKCRYDAARATGYIPYGSYQLEKGNQMQMQQVIVFEGPVATNFIVTENYKNYQSGVFNDRSCRGMTETNHAMLIVGYGVENKRQFWRAKNFWGPDWGDEGYSKVDMGSNMCGISACASFPLFFPNSQQQQQQGNLQTA